MNDNFWNCIESSEKSSTYVKNLPNGCILKVVERHEIRSTSRSVALTHLPGVIYEDGDFRVLTMQEMLGDDVGGLMGQMGGLMGSLKGFGK